VLLFLLTATAANAQGSVFSLGVAAGVVFDSLTMRPLAAATVQFRRQGAATDATGRTLYSARSDDRGRYRLDSLPAGRYIAGFFHEMLDSLGLDAPLREVQVGTRSATIDFAIPSARTIATTLCGRAAVSDSTGMLIGFVRSARTLAGATDANVFIRWTRVIIDRQRVAIEHPEAESRARDNGWYALCNVPIGLPVQIAAASGDDSSGAVEVLAQGLGVTRVDLYVGEAEPVRSDSVRVQADSVAPDSALRRGPARLTVRVRNSLGQPVAGARVSVAGSPARALTNERGTVGLVDLPSGSRMLEVRALGFVPVREQVQLLHGVDANTSDVTLTNLGAYLDTVRVTARRVFSRDVTGFERRRRAGLGRYFDRADIDRKILFRVSDLFQGIPAVTLQQTTFGENLVLMRGTFGGLCQPAVFMDGLRFGATDLDFLTMPQEIEAVEVYVRASEAPGQFTDVRYGCGTIVLWTRRYMGTSRR
jgi:hypothetical protein